MNCLAYHETDGKVKYVNVCIRQKIKYPPKWSVMELNSLCFNHFASHNTFCFQLTSPEYTIERPYRSVFSTTSTSLYYVLIMCHNFETIKSSWKWIIILCAFCKFLLSTQTFGIVPVNTSEYRIRITFYKQTIRWASYKCMECGKWKDNNNSAGMSKPTSVNEIKSFIHGNGYISFRKKVLSGLHRLRGESECNEFFFCISF